MVTINMIREVINIYYLSLDVVIEIATLRFKIGSNSCSWWDQIVAFMLMENQTGVMQKHWKLDPVQQCLIMFTLCNIPPVSS